MNTQAETIKHDILNICELWISSTSVVERVSKLVDMLENASKDISYDTGWDYGWSDGYDKGYEVGYADRDKGKSYDPNR